MTYEITKKYNLEGMSIAGQREFEIIMGNLPSDIKSVLDIGCGGFKDFYKKVFNHYICLDLKDADINQDLNFNQKIPIPNNSYDCVMMIQILEHLIFPEKVIEEAKRISKKYILISLPNEFEIGYRLRYLFNRPGDMVGFKLHGHKHKFNLECMEKMVNEMFGGYEKKFLIGGKRFKRLIGVRTFLGNIFPSLFGKRIFYLIKKGEKSKRRKRKTTSTVKELPLLPNIKI